MIQKASGVGAFASRLLVAQDEHARLDLDDLRARLLGVAEALERRLACDSSGRPLLNGFLETLSKA